MNMKKLVESIDKLIEETTSEEVLQDVPEKEPEVAPAFNDGMSLADTLESKAKIARCLENLKQAVVDFREATAEKVDLLKDEMLLNSIDEVDKAIQDIEVALAAGSKILGNSELNDAVKVELPQEQEEEPTEEQETEEENDEEDDFSGEDYDFDGEAGLDLFNPEV